MGYATVEDYLADRDDEVRAVLQELRRTIRSVLPDAEERISYQIPTFAVRGRAVVHIAGWRGHVSLYPVPRRDQELAAELAGFVAGRGTLKFPLGTPIPQELIARVVRALADERR